MNTLQIASNLLQLRKEAGKSQLEVAQDCNLTRQALSNYELGKRVPGTDMLLMLADYYGVTVDSLLR